MTLLSDTSPEFIPTGALYPFEWAGHLWWIGVCLLAVAAVTIAATGTLLWLASQGRIVLSPVRPTVNMLWVGGGMFVIGFVLAGLGDRPPELAQFGLGWLSTVVQVLGAGVGLVLVTVGVAMTWRENRGYQHRVPGLPLTLVGVGLLAFTAIITVVEVIA